MDEPKTKRAGRKWLKGLIALLALAAVGVAGWYAAGRKVWTDGRPGPDGIRVVSTDQSPRQVLWAPPVGLSLNSSEQEYEPALSPDGAELYFVRGKADGQTAVADQSAPPPSPPTTAPSTLPTTRPVSGGADIYVSVRRDNAWSTPVPLSAVNSAYDDLGPRLSADGQTLVFYSSRPGGFGGYDLWSARRKPGGEGGGWSAPINLGPTLNSPFDEYSPAPSPDGRRLYFSTNRAAAAQQQRQAWRATLRMNGAADFDLWMADLDPAGQAYVNPREVPGVNTPDHEGASCLSPGGDFLYFASNRPGGFGKFDLYRCRIVDDVVSSPQNLGPSINSADNETDPQLALAGFRLYFSSDRTPIVVSAPADLINRTADTTAPATSQDAGSDTPSSQPAVADAHDAGYDLYASDSREVFSERQTVGVPAIAWTTWLAILGCIALVPLLFLVVRMDRRRLSLLQKCLLIALLLHAGLLVSFREVAVRLAPSIARKLGFTEITISLDSPEEQIVGAAVRQQSTSDLPGAEMTAGDLAPQTTGPNELLTAPADLPSSVPQAAVGGEAATVFVAPPPAAAPAPSPAVTIAPALPPSVAVAPMALISPAINLPPPADAPEVAPQLPPSKLTEAARQPVDTPPASPAMVQPHLPGAAPAASVSLADLASAMKAMSPPAIEPPSVAIAPPLVQPTNPSVPVQNPAPPPVAVQTAEATPDLANPNAAAPSVTRAAVDAAPSAPAIDFKPMTPIATPAGQSMAAAPGVAPRPAIDVQSAIVGVSPRATARDLLAPPELPNPTSPLEPVARGDVAAQLVQPAIAPGLVRSALQEPEPAGPTMLNALGLPVAQATNSDATQTPMTAAAFHSQGALPTANVTSPAPLQMSAAAAPPVLRNIAPPAAPAAPQSVASTQPSIAIASGTSTPREQLVGPAWSASPLPAVAVAPAPVSVGEAGGASMAAPVAVLPRAANVGTTRIVPTSAMIPIEVTSPQGFGQLVSPPAPAAAAGDAPLIATVNSPGKALARVDATATETPVQLASAVAPSVSVSAKPLALASATAGPRPVVSVGPRLSLTPGPTALAGPKLDIPEPLFQRSAEQRRPMIEKLGGTQASEDAVDRGLAYLARMQEEDGRWTFVSDSAKKKQPRAAHEHDMALTGLSVLAFLAADHSPAKEGPYRQQVTAALDWMVAHQAEDGDLRGPKPNRGGGSASTNMYDHGIGTMAIAEAALMTGDHRYSEAAFKAAQFICDAQNTRTGGWRYLPGDPGDTSVFGWQVMALHNAEQLGFQTPPEVRDRAVKFLTLVSSGKNKVLAGYTPGEGPTVAMSAEALFCRTLLGQPIDGDGQSEISAFLTRDLPKPGRHDLYFWYYASLSLSQMQASPRVRQAWDVWNARCRDALVELQTREAGDADGSWTDPRWGPKGGGRIFSTAVATLTLEVYYRYLPMQPGDPAAARAAWQAAEGPKKAIKPRGPVGPKLEAN